jgi:hypothetical protein
MGAPVSVLMYDEVPGAGRSAPFRLELVSERVTVRELIERRVRGEVQKHNQAPAEIFHGLVQPTDAEQTLNGYRLPRRKLLDPDVQCRLAVEAFTAGRFFVLVDDRQVEGLDEAITIGRESEVGFFKLLPLVGG